MEKFRLYPRQRNGGLDPRSVIGKKLNYIEDNFLQRAMNPSKPSPASNIA